MEISSKSISPTVNIVSFSGALNARSAEEAKQVFGASAIQVFTKAPSQWREPTLDREEVARFKAALGEARIAAVVAHDSYLINLASPDRRLWKRSATALEAELHRCRRLGIRAVVSHPGNYMDDRERGLERNAAGYAACLQAVSGPTVLIETTAGSGTALGATFEELAEIRARIPARLRRRLGFCADTCHLHAAGYDLVNDWDGVWSHWDKVIGLRHLRCLHLNDSKTPLGSRRDRHAWIAEGTMGAAPFRRVMQDPRFRGIIKIIETPKGGDPEQHDRRMLRRLRAYGRQVPNGSS